MRERLCPLGDVLEAYVGTTEFLPCKSFQLTPSLLLLKKAETALVACSLTVEGGPSPLALYTLWMSLTIPETIVLAGVSLLLFFTQGNYEQPDRVPEGCCSLKIASQSGGNV